MINLFKTKHPKERTVYTVTEGEYKGTTILFFELDRFENLDHYITIAIGEDDSAEGGMRLFELSKDAVKEGFKNKILVKIGKLPRSLWTIFDLEYKERMKRSESDN